MLNKTIDLNAALWRTTLILLPATIVFAIIDQYPFIIEKFSRGQILGRDFYNFWFAGKLILTERIGDIYSSEQFGQAVTKELGPEAGLHLFPYPPPSFLAIASFAKIPYYLALILYSLLGLTAFTLAIGLPKLKHQLLVLTLLTPATFLNIILGQNGLLSAALLIGGLRLSGNAPLLSGLLLGLLIYKPQIAILVPALLFFNRRWLTLASAATTVILLTVVTVIIWGLDPWIDYFKQAVPFQRLTLEHGQGMMQIMKVSVFSCLRLLGFSVTESYIMHFLVAIISIAITLSYFLIHSRNDRNLNTDIIIVMIASILLTPYLHIYDLATLSGALILLANQNPNYQPNIFVVFLLSMLSSLPIAALITNFFLIPVTPIILIASLLVLTLADKEKIFAKHKISNF